MNDINPLVLVLFLALIPAVCEELFFRGFALSGLRSGLPAVASVLIASTAFGMYHYSAHKMIVTAGLGLLFGLLVVRFGSIWPAILAHLMHNTLSILSGLPGPFQERINLWGFDIESGDGPSATWTLGAAIATLIGIAVCVLGPPISRRADPVGKLAVGAAGTTNSPG